MSEMDENMMFEEPKKKKGGKWFLVVLAILVVAILCGLSTYFGIKVALEKERNTVIMYQSVDQPTYDYATQPDITGVVSDISSSVVEIYTEVATYSSFFGSYITDGAGSGVIISEDGYIVTNHHVINGALTISVKLWNGDRYDAELIASDEVTDIAVIKIDEKGLNAAVFGDSGLLKVGQRCIAIGNPLGTLGGTVTDGIISALSRTITIEGTEMTLLQTNTAINPGNSGGGLFDLNGSLIGVVNAKSSGSEIEGIGFAIPINDAKKVVEDLIAYGHVEGRAALGITGVSIDTIQRAWNYGVNEFGVYVKEVTSKNAKSAGLKEKDLIIGIDDYVVEGMSSLQSILNKYRAGDTVTLTILRNNEKIKLTIVLIQREN